jgi:hypothetical protein
LSSRLRARNVIFAVLGVAALVLKPAYHGLLEGAVYSYAGNFAVSFALYFAAVNATERYRRPRLRRLGAARRVAQAPSPRTASCASCASPKRSIISSQGAGGPFAPWPIPFIMDCMKRDIISGITFANTATAMPPNTKPNTNVASLRDMLDHPRRRRPFVLDATSSPAHSALCLTSVTRGAGSAC